MALDPCLIKICDVPLQITKVHRTRFEVAINFATSFIFFFFLILVMFRYYIYETITKEYRKEVFYYGFRITKFGIFCKVEKTNL